MDETPDPATTPVEPPAQGGPTESSPRVTRYDGWARRAGVMSRSRVTALVAGVALGAVLTGGIAAAASEFGDEHHRESGTEGSAYQQEHGNDADRPDGQDTPDPRDGGGADDIAPPIPAAPPAGSIPPAPAPAPPN